MLRHEVVRSLVALASATLVVVVGCAWVAGYTDAVPASSDAGDPYGSCGRKIYDCRCKCDAGVECSQACWDSSCLVCLDKAVKSVCLKEQSAWFACLEEATTAVDGGKAPCLASDVTCKSDYCTAVGGPLSDCLRKPEYAAAEALCLGDFPAACGK